MTRVIFFTYVFKSAATTRKKYIVLQQRSVILKTAQSFLMTNLEQFYSKGVLF